MKDKIKIYPEIPFDEAVIGIVQRLIPFLPSQSQEPSDIQNESQIERLLGPKEVGEILSLRRSKIHRMISTGEIPSVIVSQGARRRVFRVKPSALLQWIKQREVRG